MGATASALPVRRGHRLYVDLAYTADDLRAARALRYKVFGEETGARLKGARRRPDADELDPFCQHLLVRETDSDPRHFLERAARS